MDMKYRHYVHGRKKNKMCQGKREGEEKVDGIREYHINATGS